jgi:hypothetical protein
MTARLYAGRRLGANEAAPVAVTADGRPLSPAASLKLRNHSPDGFNWGYGGSGPAQLALAILLDYTGDPALAERHYQAFKAAHVAHWGYQWELTAEQIQTWLKDQGVPL